MDPFGHGNTVPYLLAASGIKGTVIQRIHYAWKQWFALKQFGDFKWVPNWSPSDPYGSILTHNQPFDIYSIKHSCGPHPYICLNFDFRKVPGEYTEYSLKAQTINEKNVKEKSELLLEQYSRTGSLFPHNVVLMPLGDDFRYNVEEEWDQQYTNYIKLIDYINAHKDVYKAEVQFGTPADYFKEIMRRYDQYPTLKGDFFVYSDIFAEGRPAYWSGYYTTRPFMKILDRQLENSLRATEILYTIALNNAKQNKLLPHSKILERDFERLVKARRNLGLFQHHDAITGTSKSYVMRDYGMKLFEGIRDTVNIQQNALQSLVFPNIPIKPDQSLLLSDKERESYEKLPRKTPIQLGPVGANQTRKVMLYNSLAQAQDYLIQIRTNTSNVKVSDANGHEIKFQVNPVWETGETSIKFWVAADEYEIVFVAKLPPLSVTTFNIIYKSGDMESLATVYCKKCEKKTVILNTDNSVQGESIKSKFIIKEIPTGDIQLENSKLKILFSGQTGFLKTVTRKHKPKKMQCAIQFASYRSAQFHSGAYLFMPDPNERDYEKDVLLGYKEQMSVIITTGPVTAEIMVTYGPFLRHVVKIFLGDNTLTDSIMIENVVNFESPPKNRETELFMRIVSDVQNGDTPEFFSDLNGFNMQKRVKVERIGLEGNYYPITSMAYIQDENIRLSLLTDHAQGVASWQPGFLEVMLDRRTLYDDSRGMGEGVVDNRETISHYWLLIEDIEVKSDEKFAPPKRFEEENPFEKGDVVRSFNLPTEGPSVGETIKSESFSRPSLHATQLANALNYPVSVFIVDPDHQNDVNKTLQFVNEPLPCDVHLLTLRTQPDPIYSQFPSSSALMVLHRQGYDCSVNSNFTCNVNSIAEHFNFHYVGVKDIETKSLTGLDSLFSLDKLGDVYVEPMSLKTINITFG